MAQRPSFDMTKMTTPDKILAGGSLLLFIDSFLPWQRACVSLTGFASICGSATAWGGNGSFAGVIMALLALALIVAEALVIMNVTIPPTVPMPTVLAALTGGTVLFALLKFLLVVSKKGSWGAYIGLILALAIAYGGWMKMQAGKALPPSGGTGFPTTP